MRLRLDADAIGQAVRLLLQARGLRAADVPIELHARGAGFEVEVELAPAPGRPRPRVVDDDPAGLVLPLEDVLAQAREQAVLGALLVTRNNKRRAAKLLGIDERSIHRLVAQISGRTSGTP